jgi:phage baseplate assembly protein W
VTSRVIAAAVFGAMEVWMQRETRSMADLADITQSTLAALETGLGADGMFRHY